MNRADYLYSELRKYANESNGTLSDAEKDRAIVATVAHIVEQDFGYMMGREAWVQYVGGRSKHLPVSQVERTDNWKGRNAR